MASVIITKGALDETKVLFADTSDKEKFRLGMLEFGQVLDAVYSGLPVSGSGEIEPANRVNGFIKAFTDVIGVDEDNPTEYFAYFIRKSGKPRKIHTPKLVKKRRGKIEDENGNPIPIDDEDKVKYIVVFTFKNNAGNRKKFRIIAKPDFNRRMHVSLPEKPDLASYLTVTVEEFKKINNDNKERMYLLANVLLSRCK